MCPLVSTYLRACMVCVNDMNLLLLVDAVPLITLFIIACKHMTNCSWDSTVKLHLTSVMQRDDVETPIFENDDSC